MNHDPEVWRRQLEQVFGTAHTDGTELVVVSWNLSQRRTDHALVGIVPPVGFPSLFRQLQGAPFVSILVLQGEVPPPFSHLAMAFDGIVAVAGSSLKFSQHVESQLPADCRLPPRARHRLALRAIQLGKLGLGECVESARAAARVVDGWQDAVSGASAIALRELRAATRTLHGGRDLTRVVYSISLRVRS